MDIKSALGKNIQYLRKSQGFTQEKLAEKINLDVTSLSKIETGKNYPLPETLDKISKALNVEVAQLFAFDKYLNNDEYIKAINKNINLIKNNKEKLKILYKISSDII